jgi:peptide/nickel transport system ATP-binding protein
VSGGPVASGVVSTLELNDIRVEYSRAGKATVQAVAGVTLRVERGQIVGLVGESGCGKSTLARAATGLVGLRTGAVSFEGHPVTRLGWRARPQPDVRLQMIFQDPYSSLNPRRRVGSQILQAVALAAKIPPQRRAGRIEQLLEQVGLPASAARAYPHELSGGQRQRVCIARALAAEPTMIVADEPISALDSSAQAQIATLLTQLTRSLNVGLLFISHDLSIVRHIADVVYVMYLGMVVEVGSPADIWAQPLHPYTEALIKAIPRPDGRRVLPDAVAGEVPDPANPPRACRFHPRCPYAFERCREESPPLTPIGVGRVASCWLRVPDARADLPA